jgi:hypothetical protein
MKSPIPVSTGLTGLDKILNNLIIGDNVVWQVDSIDDYKKFVTPYVAEALKNSIRVVYFRFAKHRPLLEETHGVDIHTLDAMSGFETFSKNIYKLATEYGENTFYVFDCLSDLLTAWATDLMIGNFFVITCPYLYRLNTIAYFALYRNNHDHKTIARIRETTQVLIDVHRTDRNIYVHPIKVENRYSPTMFLPHSWKDDRFTPVTNINEAVDFLSYMQNQDLETGRRNLDFWDQLFLDASRLVRESAPREETRGMVEHLCSLMIGRDPRILELATGHFTLEYLISLKNRMIGTGFIGGKAAGMLIARMILQRDSGTDWSALIEPHDSFYIGTDVFYSYIVQNRCWELLMKQKNDEYYFSAAQELHDRILEGNFPESIKEQFQRMIEYYGQSPIIVRSSSILEDAFGNAFAGKYDSYFCVNRGTPRERYEKFTEAVRKIFASTMNEDALAYRLQRGLDRMDEQMALLVMRVSGKHHGKYFFPDIGGVGLSYNTYVWNKDIDPSAGMVRIVFGLGTRAVNRVEGDYPRIVALDSPLQLPLAGSKDLRRFSQHYVDLLDAEMNSITTVSFESLMKELPGLELEYVAEKDFDASRQLQEMGIDGPDPWIINFQKLLSDQEFIKRMKSLLRRIETVYDYPVDVEFTVNFNTGGGYMINLLQCRPHQIRGFNQLVSIPKSIPLDKIVLRSYRHFLGGNISATVNRLIYVDPEGYTALSQSEKYDVARLVGKLNRLIENRQEQSTMLIGPGRWGTTTPSLGVPVRFAEINRINILVELSKMSDDIMPELSFGTHFFLDLVETEIFYIAVFPEREEVYFNMNYFADYPNTLTVLLPDDSKYENIVRVYDLSAGPIQIMSYIVSQDIVCFFK